MLCYCLERMGVLALHLLLTQSEKSVHFTDPYGKLMSLTKSGRS